MFKILVNYSSVYFDELKECDCYVGNDKLFGCDNSEDVQSSVDNWFRNVFYRNRELKRFSFIFEDVTDVYNEYIKTDKSNLKHDTLLKKLCGHKKYIRI